MRSRAPSGATNPHDAEGLRRGSQALKRRFGVPLVQIAHSRAGVAARCLQIGHSTAGVPHLHLQLGRSPVVSSRSTRADRLLTGWSSRSAATGRLLTRWSERPATRNRQLTHQTDLKSCSYPYNHHPNRASDSMKISVLASICPLLGAQIGSSGVRICDRIDARGLGLPRFSGRPGNGRGSIKRATPLLTRW